MCPFCCMETANISSVMPKAIAKRLTRGILGSIFWESDKDISIYLILIIKVVTANSIRLPAPIIIAVPANCPADVRLVIDITTESQTGNPPFVAIIPNVKETDIYPRQMGIPSLSPCLNVIVKKAHLFLNCGVTWGLTPVHIKFDKLCRVCLL